MCSCVISFPQVWAGPRTLLLINRIKWRTSEMLYSGLGDQKRLASALLACSNGSQLPLLWEAHKAKSWGRSLSQQPARSWCPRRTNPQGSESCNHVSIVGGGAFGVQPWGSYSHRNTLTTALWETQTEDPANRDRIPDPWKLWEKSVLFFSKAAKFQGNFFSMDN